MSALTVNNYDYSISYQWFINDETIASATSDDLVLIKVGATYQYFYKNNLQRIGFDPQAEIDFSINGKSYRAYRPTIEKNYV